MCEQAHGVNGREFTKFTFDTSLRQALLIGTMKKLLSLLMCYVFLQAETFALRGGPSSKGGVEQVGGAYSGILVDSSGTGGALGLFLLTAIDNGASVGQIVFFSSSALDVDTYYGTITGLNDTTKGKLTAIFGATDATNLAGTFTISGQLSVTAVKGSTGSTQRLTGTGTSRNISIITSIFSGTVIKTVGPLITYVVDGFRTSTSTAGNPFPTSF